MKTMLAIAALIVVSAQAADRFPVLATEKLTTEKHRLIQALMAGPRGGGEADPEAVQKMLNRGPFNAWLRSPELGERLQKVGEYIRFNPSLPLRMNELAILITARHWSSQYEWYAHLPLALKAGLDPQIAADLAENRRPRGMKDDEAAIYAFCVELHRKKKVSDAADKRVVARFAEKV